MDEDLLKRSCVPCKGGSIPLSEARAEELHKQLKEGWFLEENHHLEKQYDFSNFKEALDFTNAIGLIAEKEGHHPDIYLGWGKVFIILLTHKIDGLSENDFILAAKFDEAYSNK